MCGHGGKVGGRRYGRRLEGEEDAKDGEGERQFPRSPLPLGRQKVVPADLLRINHVTPERLSPVLFVAQEAEVVRACPVDGNYGKNSRKAGGRYKKLWAPLKVRGCAKSTRPPHTTPPTHTHSASARRDSTL